MKRTLPVLMACLLALPALAVDRSDCDRIAHLGTLYQLRSLMLGGQRSSYEIQQFIDHRIEVLREPIPDGGYRWVRYVRPSGEGSFDKHVHKVRAVHDADAPDFFEANGQHAYAVRIVVPSKRSLFKGNHPVYVGDVRISHNNGNAVPSTETMHIDRWMSPDTSQTFDLRGIYDLVAAVAPLSADKRDRDEAVAEIHFAEAVAQDDPANPGYATIRALLRIGSSPDPSTVDGEIAALEGTLYQGVQTVPLLTLMRDLRRARELMASEKTADQEKGSRLLKETLDRLR